MEPMKLMTKHIPAYLVLAMLAATVAGSVAVYASILSASTRTVTTVGGEVFILTEELTVTPLGIHITTADASAAGDTLANNVTITTAGASANTALTKGNFEYKLNVTVATVSAGQEYSVELFQGGTSKGKIYIGQVTGTQVGDYAILKWDLGTSLDDQVYEIQVLPA